MVVVLHDNKAISLEEIKNESVDLERIPVEEVFEQLKCTKEGLTREEGEQRLQIFGPNKLEEENALMAIGLANGGGKPPDWQDFVGIIVLLIINSTISFIEENNAGNAAAALMAGLAPKTKVLRDGKWSEEEAAILVPGDVISIKLGDIVPADARLLEGDPLKIDQSALTGESLPVTKHPGDEIFSGSTCKQGEIEAVVIATGVHTFFGKAAHLVDSTNQVGHFQQVLTAIGNFCICSIAIGMVVEIVVMYPIQQRKYREGIDNLLVLLIGGIPIAMPTVLSVTMAIGSHRLSEQGAITKRMTAIEEMAGMDVLCSDKTGTLTLNKLTVDKTMIEVFVKDMDKDTVVLIAARASRVENQDAIDTSIVGVLADPKEDVLCFAFLCFVGKSRDPLRCISCPSTPVEKRTAITYYDSDGNWHRASKGAPEQVIPEKTGEWRVGNGNSWVSCRLRPSQQGGVIVQRPYRRGPQPRLSLKISGDQLAIGKELGRRLGMGTNMYPASFPPWAVPGLIHSLDIPVDERLRRLMALPVVFPVL
ncbi:hypothetical protein HHK36_031563 [Tetracentron sinense]|uniref:Cation-transporting P-type ATPase N-terminal domain-containing protein n=1 Tax=Tetracentron sinense TaxID=13715 RepID=A0A835CYF0_TETSI|nr:hypothetical protein HHK36_031563 [Tetracentron sinense]